MGLYAFHRFSYFEIYLNFYSYKNVFIISFFLENILRCHFMQMFTQWLNNRKESGGRNISFWGKLVEPIVGKIP